MDRTQMIEVIDNPSATPEELYYVALDKSVDILMRLAERTTLPERVIAFLANHSRWEVRATIALSGLVSSNQLKELANDPHPSVCRNARILLRRKISVSPLKGLVR